MLTRTRVHLQALVLLIFVVHPSLPVCVDVPSDTEAVLGKPMMLTCISCMRREEVRAKTRVDWYFLPNEDTPRISIYKYEEDTPKESEGPFKGRLTWNGSQDLQDVSIQITNVTFNDSGIYECRVIRKFEFDVFTPSVSISKNFTLSVKEKGALWSFSSLAVQRSNIFMSGTQCSLFTTTRLSMHLNTHSSTDLLYGWGNTSK
ncbi:sodium channel subunit beta-3 isoform X2 [Channa argus]|uniref:sodium channel subunit beta-3 isoform X2 n=1 Tax=Channa argus TaxID=215402 RepID=UPI0035230FC8